MKPSDMRVEGGSDYIPNVVIDAAKCFDDGRSAEWPFHSEGYEHERLYLHLHFWVASALRRNDLEPTEYCAVFKRLNGEHDDSFDFGPVVGNVITDFGLGGVTEVVGSQVVPVLVYLHERFEHSQGMTVRAMRSVIWLQP